MATEVILHPRVCRCGTTFYICRPCDRGQRYCSGHCRQKARREQRREANRRYQQSLEGRLDHRDRQRVYRQRRRSREESVTDQASPEDRCSEMMPTPERVTSPASANVISARCIRCGRAGDESRQEAKETKELKQASTAIATEQEYVRSVLRAYIALPETPPRWHSTDRQIAVGLFRRQIPLEIVETAFVLGSARRLGRNPQKIVPPIRCLAYFLPLIDEVLTLPPPPRYVAYLRSRLPDLVRNLSLMNTT